MGGESRGCAEVELQVKLQTSHIPRFPSTMVRGSAKPASYGMRQRPEALCLEFLDDDLDLLGQFPRTALATFYKHVPNSPAWRCMKL